MLDLADFQAAFAAALSEGTDAIPIASAPAFAVYRNTSVKGAIEALRANYRTVACLLGEDMFADAAIAFVRHFPPRSSILAHFGEDFPDFLANSELPDGHNSLVAIAQLDRAATEAHLAADAQTLHPSRLTHLGPEDWMRVRLTLHPACRFSWFADSVPSQWLGLRDGLPIVDVLPGACSEGIVMTRPYGRVDSRLAGRDEFLFLDAVANGHSAAAAALEAMACTSQIDLAALFAQLIADGAFSTIEEFEDE